MALDREMSADLENLTALFSDDPAKAEMELTCTICGAILCDIESGDSFTALVATGMSHLESHGDGALG